MNLDPYRPNVPTWWRTLPSPTIAAIPTTLITVTITAWIIQTTT